MALVSLLLQQIKTTSTLVCDGSVKIPCCKERLQVSLQMLKIFTDGKSWYESVGASSAAYHHHFRAHFENNVAQHRLEAALAQPKNSIWSRYLFSTPASFNYAYDDGYSALASEYMNTFTSARGYKKAKQYLHNLEIEPLAKSVKRLSEKNPQLHSLAMVMEKALEVRTDSRETIGQLITGLKHNHLNTPVHSLLHDLYEQVIANRKSGYCSAATHRLSAERGQATPVGCAVAFSLLAHATHQLWDTAFWFDSFVDAVSSFFDDPMRKRATLQALLRLPLEEHRQRIPNFIQYLWDFPSLVPLLQLGNPEVTMNDIVKVVKKEAPDRLQQILNNFVCCISNDLAKYPPEHHVGSIALERERLLCWFNKDVKSKIEKNIQVYDQSLEPPIVKMRAHADKAQMASFVTDEYPIAGVALESIVFPALQYITSLPLADFRKICPEIVAGWEKRLNETYKGNDQHEYMQGSVKRFLQLLQIADKNAPQHIVHDLVLEAIRNLEKIMEPLFAKHLTSDTYFVMIIAKQLVQLKWHFTL